MSGKKIEIFIAVAIFFVSCETRESETPIAEAGGKKLYFADIRDYLHDLSGDDSIAVLTSFVNNWAKNQMVLEKAEKNLSKKELDLSEELNNYRMSLLIHKYEQLYLRERMDTIVRPSEIESFYKNNPANFQLTGVLVKAVFVKISNMSRNIDRVRLLCRSSKEQDIEELGKLALEGAAEVVFSDSWVDLPAIAALLPGDTEFYENRLLKVKYVEDSDEQSSYILKINDLLLKGTTAPLEHVEADIRNIILNRRKTSLIRKMENDIFNEAIDNNEIKINIAK
jgi:hypothetical protein